MRRGWFFALLLLIAGFYTFLVSAGIEEWPVYGVYHDLQADGFLKGQLSLPVAPDPHVLSAKDPYDIANIDYWLLDVSYYKGKYYIYWGPVPALVDAAAKWLLGVHRMVGDQYLTLFFHCLAFWCGALLIERMLRRLFASESRPLLVLGALVFAFANPTPHSATTASTYHAAIIAAQAWLMAGLLVAFDAVWHAGSSEARAWRMPTIGLLWALAMGSRVTVLPAVALLVLLTAAAVAWPAERRAKRVILDLLGLGLPLTAAGLGLLYYNKIRFDHWFEFGSTLQLSGMPRFRVSSVYLLPNLYSYAFRPWDTSCAFPYLYQVWNMGASSAFPRQLSVPADYNTIEPVVGWMLAVPLAWLCPVAFLLSPRPSARTSRRDRAYLFCLVSFSVLIAVTGLVELGLYTTTMRYLGDVTFGLVLLALLAGYGLRFHRFGVAQPRVASGLLYVLGTATIVIGLLLGYQGYNAHFHRYNPKLDHKLVKALSLCGKVLPEPPTWMN